LLNLSSRLILINSILPKCSIKSDFPELNVPNVPATTGVNQKINRIVEIAIVLEVISLLATKRSSIIMKGI